MGVNTHFVVVCVLQNLQTRTSYIYTYIFNMGSDNLLKLMKVYMQRPNVLT